MHVIKDSLKWAVNSHGKLIINNEKLIMMNDNTEDKQDENISQIPLLECGCFFRNNLLLSDRRVQS